MVQAQWAWTNDQGAGRWSTPEQVYKLARLYTPEDVNDELEYGFTVISSKVPLRGQGEALSLFFETSPGNDCHIYGWGKEIVLENNS
jgi:hypothetical protein